MGSASQPGSDPARAANQIAHDLGTAVALISGHADALREALGPSAPGSEAGAAVDGIERGVARLRRVSEELTAWAHTQTGL